MRFHAILPLLPILATLSLSAADQQDPPPREHHRGPPPADPALFYLADADKSGGLNNAELVNYLDALALRRPPKPPADGKGPADGKVPADGKGPGKPADGQDGGPPKGDHGDHPKGDRPPHEPPAPPPSKEFAAHLLEVGDADKNGELNFKELEQAMRPPEPPPRN